jgi:type II secretory pathway pseudopilin PulG
VVISIISLLISIMVPSLRKARDSAKMAVCGSNLGQLGLAVVAYANENEGFIPRGPAKGGPFDFACDVVATNQLWIGADDLYHPQRYNGLGLLLNDYAQAPKIYYCPADNNRNLPEELPKIGTEFDAYGSYTYRQLDLLPANRPRGMFSNLGINVINGRKVRVEALAFDTNSLGPGPYRHTNHKARRVNVLYRDRSVQTFSNRRGAFSIPLEAFSNPMNIFFRLDQILVNADHGYRGSPDKAPQMATGR